MMNLARSYFPNLIVPLAAAMCAIFFAAAGSLRAQQLFSIENAFTDQENTGLIDEDGDTPAFIIIRNNSTLPRSIAGYHLSNSADNPAMWTFPAGTSIDGSGSLTVFASGKDRRPLDGSGELHTNFTYPCDIPHLGLASPEGFLVDSFSKQGECTSCERGSAVVGRKSIGRHAVPFDSRNDHVWMFPAFSDEQWARGGVCIGYEHLEDLCSGLLLYATMDQGDLDFPNRTVFDVSGPTIHNGNYPGLDTGDLTSGQIAQGLIFDGNPQTGYVRFGNHPELNPQGNSLTASIWLRPEADSGTQVILFKGGSGANDPGYMLILEENRAIWRFVFSIPGSPPAVVDVVSDRPKAGEWSHLMAVVDRTSNMITSYFNGNPIDTRSVPFSGSLETPEFDLYLAASPTFGELNYRGAADDFALWGRALTPAERQFVHDAGAAGKSFRDEGCAGEASPMYDQIIDMDIEQQMYGQSSSVYLRAPFSVADPSAVVSATLNIHYDDAFIAYINGQEVARRNTSAPSPAPFSTVADADRPDTAALSAESIPITLQPGLFQPGANILAIHGINANPSADRFVICPELCVEVGEAPGCVKTTNARDFWLAFPGNAPTDPSNPLKLTLCMTGNPGTTGTVSIPGLAVSSSFTLNGQGTAKVSIPTDVSIETSDMVEQKGIHVTASQDVAVHAECRIDYSTDAYLGIPTGCLGRENIVLGYPNVWKDLPEILNGSQFAIVAPYDETTVTITPSADTGTHPKGVPYNVTLNRGDTYQLRNQDDDPADLSGTIISSDKPVGVFGGHRCANVNSDGIFFCDYVVEHLLPVDLWGSEYYTAPLKTRSGYVVRIVAAQDNTDIFINGAFAVTLDRAEVYETTLAAASQIVAEGKILVAQYAPSSDFDGVEKSDPFMCLAQPVDNYLGGYRVCSPPSSGFEGNYVNVIVPSALVGVVAIDGVPIPPANYQPIAGTPYFWAAETVSLGSHLVAPGGTAGDRFFGLIAYGFSQFDSYGYPGGMRFLDNQSPTVICPERVTAHCLPADPENDIGERCYIPNVIALSEIYDNQTPPGQLSVAQNPAPGTEVQGPGDYQVTITVVDGCENRETCTTIVTMLPPWQQTHFPDDYPDPEKEESVWGWDADPDGDGKKNSDEYALGCDPNDPSDADKGVTGKLAPNDGGGHTLTLTFKKRILEPAVQYFPEGSRDGSEWSRNSAVMQEMTELRTVSEDGQFYIVTYKAALTDVSDPPLHYFVRLVIDSSL